MRPKPPNGNVNIVEELQINSGTHEYQVETTRGRIYVSEWTMPAEPRELIAIYHKKESKNDGEEYPYCSLIGQDAYRPQEYGIRMISKETYTRHVKNLVEINRKKNKAYDDLDLRYKAAHKAMVFLNKQLEESRAELKIYNAIKELSEQTEGYYTGTEYTEAALMAQSVLAAAKKILAAREPLEEIKA